MNTSYFLYVLLTDKNSLIISTFIDISYVFIIGKNNEHD